jgi:hypothetical protein
VKREVRCRACGAVIGCYPLWARLLRRAPRACAFADPAREDACIERWRTGPGLRARNQRGEAEPIGVIGALGIAFVVLRLCGVIDWSWWLVTLPFWGGLALIVAVLALGALGIGVWGAVAAALSPLRRRSDAKRRHEWENRPRWDR